MPDEIPLKRNVSGCRIMVVQRSPKPLAWVRFLPRLQKIQFLKTVFFKTVTFKLDFLIAKTLLIRSSDEQNICVSF